MNTGIPSIKYAFLLRGQMNWSNVSQRTVRLVFALVLPMPFGAVTAATPSGTQPPTASAFLHGRQQTLSHGPTAVGFGAKVVEGPPMILHFSGANAAGTYNFPNEGQNVDSLPKAVIYAAMVAIATAITAPMRSDAASTVDTEFLVGLATANAKDLCGQISYSGTNVAGKVKAEANARLPGMLKKIWNRC
jgi:peptidoglycan/LPS O-acetylase OafA/YrhL